MSFKWATPIAPWKPPAYSRNRNVHRQLKEATDLASEPMPKISKISREQPQNRRRSAPASSAELLGRRCGTYGSSGFSSCPTPSVFFFGVQLAWTLTRSGAAPPVPHCRCRRRPDRRHCFSVFVGHARRRCSCAEKRRAIVGRNGGEWGFCWTLVVIRFFKHFLKCNTTFSFNGICGRRIVKKSKWG